MTASSLRTSLRGAVDGLLSLRSTPTEHAAALLEIERVVAAVSLDPATAFLDAFLRSQDDCALNVTAVLLEWLGRTLATHATTSGAANDEPLRANLVRCLRLFQGLLLLHRPSQRLFARRSSLEPFPSPVLFPPTPLSSPNLAQAALDALLCALVDRPGNLRVFEDIGGLAAIVKVLKDKSVAQPVRIKVIELLYFYLLPEAAAANPPAPDLNASFSSASASASSTLDSRVFADSNNLPTLFASAADFIPQTPSLTSLKTLAAPPDSVLPPPAFSRSVAARPHQQPLGSSSSRLDLPSRSPRPPRPRASFSASGDDSDSTPRAARLARADRPPPSLSSPEPSPRASHRRSQSLLSSAGLPAPPPRTPAAGSVAPRRARASRSSSDVDADAEAMPPPRAPLSRGGGGLARSRSVAGGLERRASGAERSASGGTGAEGRGTSSSSGSSSAASGSSSYTSLSSASSLAPAPKPPPPAARHTRTEGEKKELLRRVMPNVDALEERFRAMGLGLG
ncbi:hypothetical protein JCM10449v2_001162 [Rhodotorula kratochvilovae]